MKGRKITLIALAAALVVAVSAILILPRLSPDPTSLRSYAEMLSEGDRLRLTDLAPLTSAAGDIERVEASLGRGDARGWRFPTGDFFWIERSDRAFTLELEGFGVIEYGHLQSNGDLSHYGASTPYIVRGSRYSAIVQPPLARASEVVDGHKQPTLDGTNYVALDEFNGSVAYSDGKLRIECPGGGASDWWIYLTPHDIAPRSDYTWMNDCTLEKFGADNRMTIDGYYYRTPADYTPSGDGYFFLNPAAYIAGKLARNTDHPDAHYLAAAMLDIQRSHYNDYGFVPTYSTSNWLSTDYSVAPGFYDTRFNTELADALLTLGRAEGVQSFVDDALRYAAFLNNHALTRSTDDGAGGIFVDDYWHPDGCERTHSSLNHQLSEALFLIKTENADYTETAYRMIHAVESSACDWIKPDGDLHYARYPDGSFGGADYPYLTYNDLLALDRWLGGSPSLERLMDSKRGWMDAKGITGYNK